MAIPVVLPYALHSSIPYWVTVSFSSLGFNQSDTPFNVEQNPPENFTCIGTADSADEQTSTVPMIKD